MDPSNPGAIDMRRTKLKASEAALIAGELVKPSWTSRNEGLHERVSFEDTLWGFEMAGGAYYKTPLRVAYVRPGSRAERACIRMGDTVLRISGRDTADLTLQEAHQLVLEAGIDLKIAVTSPEDKVNALYNYQDEIVEEPALTPEQLKAMELERVNKALARASRCRELTWPWVRRKWLIYRESNCFMVPSKYENKHRDEFPELSSQRYVYFYPDNKANKDKNKNITDNVKALKENITDETLKKDEKYEEVKKEGEEENQIDEGVEKQESSERLEDNTSDNHVSNSGENGSNTNLEEISTNELDPESENSENIDENSKRKDSNQSASSFELDNNNNHVAKHKNEQINEEIQNGDPSDDRIINEIVENANDVLENNLNTNDDDIIDSVLNDNIDSDSQSER